MGEEAKRERGAVSKEAPNPIGAVDEVFDAVGRQSLRRLLELHIVAVRV